MPRYKVTMRCRNNHGIDIVTRRLAASKQHKAEFFAVKELERQCPEYDVIEPTKTEICE